MAVESATGDVAVLTRMVTRTVTVGDLIEHPLLVVAASDPLDSVRDLMSARDFDLVGVDSTGDGFADRFLTRPEAKGATLTRRVAQPVMACDAVEKSLPLAGLMRLLRDRPYVFVLDGDHVGYVLTRADLARPAVTMVVFAYIAAAEKALARLAISRHGSRWLEALGERRGGVVGLYARKRRLNTELGLERCLLFADVAMLARSAPRLLDDLGHSEESLDRLLARLEPLRNVVAHGGSVLDALTANQALDTFDQLRALNDRAWALVNSMPTSGPVYREGWVIRENDGTEWAGPRALPRLPGQVPIAVLTAWNSGGATRPERENRKTQRLLCRRIDAAGHLRTYVTVESGDGVWTIPSIAVPGLSHRTAARWSSEYGQPSYIRLSQRGVSVMSASEGRTMWEAPRRTAT